MTDSDRAWKERFAALPPRGAAGPCPRAEALSAWAKSALPEDGLAHLASCRACREDLIEVRRILSEKAPTEAPRGALRNRLYALAPSRRIPIRWRVAAAAAATLLAVLATLLSRSGEPLPVPKPMAVQPKEKPQPMPAPEPKPELPRVVGKPESPGIVPSVPEKPPPPPVPEAAKEPPVVVKPAPEPEKPAPLPEKPPAPVPTRARLRGSLLAVSGSVSTQADADVWQPLRVAQTRDFMGAVKIRADVAASKVRVGVHTVYLQRGGELALSLEEGRTHVTLARGEAFFDVTPGRDPFEVETVHGLVTVKGTRFLVALDKNETEVAVQRGAVQFNAMALAAGERSTGGAPQKADLARRLPWVRALEEILRIEGEQMALSGGMAILADAAASGGRAIGAKAGPDAVAEISARRKQPVPYSFWIRLHWAHGVPSALSLSVGDALTWSSKDVVANPNWQWVRAGSAELPDGPFRVRLTDTHGGIRIDQIVITSDPDFTPEDRK
jgi:ferric-dicitrate binding protein FerR (iron transport regulator)